MDTPTPVKLVMLAVDPSGRWRQPKRVRRSYNFRVGSLRDLRELVSDFHLYRTRADRHPYYERIRWFVVVGGRWYNPDAKLPGSLCKLLKSGTWIYRSINELVFVWMGGQYRGFSQGSEQRAEIEAADIVVEELRPMFEGDPKQHDPQVFLILRHRSQSGAFRIIDPIIISKGQPRWYRHAIGIVTGLKSDPDREGLRISGGGMDMGFWLVSTLSKKLYGDSDILKSRWL